MEKTNLYNVDMKSNKHKTRSVIKYIERLNIGEKDKYSHTSLKRWNHFKSLALKETNPDKMLDRIRYNPTGNDGIYQTLRLAPITTKIKNFK